MFFKLLLVVSFSDIQYIYSSKPLGVVLSLYSAMHVAFFSKVYIYNDT